MDEDQVIQSILRRLDRLSDEFRELRDGVRKVIRIAPDDPEMALTRSRKVLEYLIRDLYVRRYDEEPGTRPLENLLQRLARDGHLPKRLGAYANAIRELGNVGTHGYGEAVTTSDVRQSLSQLMVLLEWYFENERPEGVIHTGDLRLPVPTAVPPSQPTADSVPPEVRAQVQIPPQEPLEPPDPQPAKEEPGNWETGTATTFNQPTKDSAKSKRRLDWVISLILGVVAGVAGGQITDAILSANLTSLDHPAVLVICGLIPAVVASFAVTRVSRILLQIVLALFVGAMAVEVVFFLGFLMAGGDVAFFVRHLPFWLGPGDERILVGESLMLGFLLGAFSGTLAGILQGLKTKLFRR